MIAPPPPSSSQFSLADRLAHRGIHYGWVIVEVTFLTMMVGACAVGAPGVLIGPLQAEFGWDIADISAAFAVRLALFGLVGPFAAVLLNHFGIRLVSTVALALIGIGVIGSLASWQPATCCGRELGSASRHVMDTTWLVPSGKDDTSRSVYSFPRMFAPFATALHPTQFRTRRQQTRVRYALNSSVW